MVDPLDDFGRFSEPARLIMSSLAEGPKHGYAMVKDVDDFAGVKLGAGTLYGALSRLESRGWIEALPAQGRQRPYRLTASGAEVLTAQLQRLQRTTTVALRRLGLA
jgi:DNA-binding PadR family transcriptional regulator